jgi:hypothetical protein
MTGWRRIAIAHLMVELGAIDPAICLTLEMIVIRALIFLSRLDP